jgi:hypothetical protein
VFGDIIFAVDTFAEAERTIGQGNRYLFISGDFHDKFPFYGVLSRELYSTFGIARTLVITEEL